MFVYLYALKALGDPRVQGFRIDKSEMNLLESVWLALTVFGLVFVWARSLWRSYCSLQIGWLLAIFFVWPLAAFYVWRKE